MASVDSRLSSFLSYLTSYLHSYRKRYNKNPGDVIALRFLVGNVDTVTIYCAPTEPPNLELKVDDFWYSGTLLRKCVAKNFDDDKAVVRSYKVCYKYDEAFVSTILSLNPALNGEGPPPTVTQNPSEPGSMNQGDPILSGGGTMLGPLYLRSKIIDSREATSKAYVDGLISQQQLTINALSTMVGRVSSESAQTVGLMNKLQRDLQDLLALKVIRVSKTTPATDWPVVHNHGSHFAIVQVYDLNGELVIPDKVEIVNENAIRLKFAVPVAGRAVVFLPKE